MKKRTSKAFGKVVYLLGTNEYDRLQWLEAPKFDCGWYWGFGYIEEYTNHHNPSQSRDITSHSHMSGLMKKSDNLFDSFKTPAFTKEEGAQLFILFVEFYAARKEADRNHRTNEAEHNRINKEVIPLITKQITDILTPNQ